ncbi:cupin domain-containing protein [Jannaschia ovalis]|uniref:Cupin domain-containing protein n=1 Tax=Jannaschia ovalis TaxID=3038773 RepID=A0ABY8LHF1_9RHOB|nr:cupin domain-containing protein [Jannaschia sp. GRR-S6-38]WGH79528.1 cupin domain-containing protein [Jannaschia sp. GRR-S6-38]
MVEKRAPKDPVHIPAAAGAFAKGNWSGSIAGGALDTEALILFFASDDIGAGPGLHLHPYDEIFIVKMGRARFTVGERVFEAGAGDVVMGPATVPHRYENIGPGRLETIDIHLSREWIQTDLEG